LNGLHRRRDIPTCPEECPLRNPDMASLGVRMSRVNRSLLRVSSRPSASLVCGKRGLATSGCLRYQASLARFHETVPADKYQRTTITEDVQRIAAQEAWADPRGTKVNLDQTSYEAMVDPTIRHFTVNFVSLHVNCDMVLIRV
jgi:hypothetical protein